MKPIAACFFFLTFLGGAVGAQEAAPQWYLDEIATLTAGSGRWVADNARYKSDEEPFDAYVTEWRSSFGGTTMTGRLFGMQDGEETASFWEFRQYWHPERREVVVEQFGHGGSAGIGTAWHDGQATKSQQTFYSPARPPSKTGHSSWFPDQQTHVTESFDINGDTWKPRRVYTWKLVSPD